MNQILKHTSTQQSNSRLDQWLAEQTDLSRSRIKNLILDGQVQMQAQDGQAQGKNRPILNPATQVKPHTTYSVNIPAAISAIPQAENIELDILYEDRDIICINKNAGMVVHPAPGAYSGTLVNALLAHCGNSLTGIGGVARPGIVHRLDKYTSGVMVAAKTHTAHQRLTDMFAAHDLKRHYHALIWGMPNERQGTINAPIARHKIDRKKQHVTNNGRNAITHYKILRDLPPFGGLIDCELETGRTHQIRVHLSHIGHGIIGDPLYGTPKRLGQMPDKISRTTLNTLRQFPRQALHAISLSFAHPITGKPLSFTTELPKDMLELLGCIETAVYERGHA